MPKGRPRINKHVSKEISENEVVLEYKGKHISVDTLEDAIKYFKVDTKIYDVVKHVINKWDVVLKSQHGFPEQVTNTQVKLWLKPKQENKNEVLRTLQKEIIADIQRKTKTVKLKNKIQHTDHILQINIFDAHIDKLGWIDGEYEEGTKIIDRVGSGLLISLENLLTKAQNYHPEYILLPIGNDFFNHNGDHHTKRGTPQTSLQNWKGTFRWGIKLINDMVSTLTTIAPVKIVIVPSNHDEDQIFYLGEVLEAMFSKNKNITVMNKHENRSYVTFGKNLIGFTHGDKNVEVENLPYLMANECSKDWANCTYKEFHIGHLHHSQSIKYKNTKETKGVLVRYMRSSNPIHDKWSSDMGYVMSHSSIEAFVWDKEGGIIANFTEYIK